MATTVLTYNAQGGAEIAAAIGWIDNLTNGGGAPRSATETEAKAHLAKYLNDLVRSHKDAVRKAALAAIPDIVIT